MAVKTIAFEPEKYFAQPDAQARLVAGAVHSDDAQFLIDAIAVVARARGMTELARETGMTRQALYAAFGPKGNPTISTVMRVLTALGMTLEVRRAA